MPKKMPKKLKKPSAATPHIPADIIIENILPRMSPRHALALVSCAKSMMLALTYDIVLGSAVFATNRGHKNLELTVRLVKDGDIWLPSPLRLLRLLAGRTCELKAADDKQCCGRLNFLRSWCGVHACWPCTQRCRTTTSSKSMAALRNHARAASTGSARKTFWTDDLLGAGGERIGPLFTMQSMRRMACDPAALPAMLALADAKPEAKQALLAAYAVYRVGIRLREFLSEAGRLDQEARLRENGIDFEALLRCNDDDLKRLGMRKKSRVKILATRSKFLRGTATEEDESSVAVQIRRGAALADEAMLRTAALADEAMLRTLAEMGFAERLARRAMQLTGGRDTEAALEWLCENVE